MKANEKFSQDICNILREAAEEKMETASQEDAEPEETIYSGGFDTFNKDVPLFKKFHESDWKNKCDAKIVSVSLRARHFFSFVPVHRCFF